MVKNRTCCFTGHRNIAMCDVPYVLQRTTEYVHMLIDRGIIYLGVDGALGFDSLAAEMLFKIRDTEYPRMKVILVYPFDGYTNRWNDKQKEKHRIRLPLYDKVVCVFERCNKDAYLERNRYLADHSGYCVCYCNRSWGGTAYTVRYAKQRNLEVYNIGSLDLKTL